MGGGGGSLEGYEDGDSLTWLPDGWQLLCFYNLVIDSTMTHEISGLA